jgi:hypothetical protein
MIIGFLIATLIIFTINLVVNVLVIGLTFSEEESIAPVTLINIVITLLILTWNIIAIITL